jgi:hypothetical protein
MDVSSSVAVFEFIDAEAAEAMIVQRLPHVTMQRALPYYWVVQYSTHIISDIVSHTENAKKICTQHMR